MSAVAHNQDPAINERRMRPIYDHLDVGNNKKALQEADKVLRKYPNIQCARALKALVLLRLQRDDDATAIIEKLAAEHPTDEPTLQVLTYCYKDQDDLEKIAELYANAARQQPTSEELLSHLFMAHVRCYNYAAQQLVALQLYKLNPTKNPYYFWAVMSCVLKALRGPEAAVPAKRTLLLTLAQRMIDKHIADGKLDAEQEAHLYLIVLELQGKWAEELSFLESDVGRRLYPGAPVQLRIKAMRELGMETELEALMKELLWDNRDRWDYHTEYIECVIRQHGTGPLHSLRDVAVDALRPAYRYMEAICVEDERPARGPYLGRLLLHKLLQRHDFEHTEQLFDGRTMLQLLVEFFELFGHKPSCTFDFQQFLCVLRADERAGLAERLMAVCGVSAATLPQTRDQMQQHICTLQIARICGAHQVGVEHLTALYTAFSLHYEHGMTAFGMDMLPTDMGPSDAYALLAAHVMYDLAQQLRSSAPLIEALCLLQYVLSNSPSNFHAKLLCLQIYHRLGCGWGAHKTWETLDVKHIQLDSMGYLHVAQLPATGCPSVAKPLYDTTLKFFTTNYKELLDLFTQAYRYGSFSKIDEFMRFRDKLASSFQYALVSAEALMLAMVGMSAASAEQTVQSVSEFNLEPRADRLDVAGLCDNRDLSVVMRWDAPQEAADAERHTLVSATCPVCGPACGRPAALESHRQDVQLLRLRSLMLRVCGACVELYDADVELAEALQTVELLRVRWRELVAEVRAMQLRPASVERLANLLPSRVHGQLAQPYEAFFDALMGCVLVLERGVGGDAAPVTLPELQAATERLAAVLGEVEERARERIERHSECEDRLWERQAVQEVYVNCLEIFALAALVLSVAAEKYKQLGAIKKKTKPKAAAAQAAAEAASDANAATDRDRMAAVQSLVATLLGNLATMDDLIRNWTPPLCPDNLVERIAAMSLNPNVEPVVQTTLRDGHTIAVKELRTIIREKQRMLQRGRD